MPYYCHVESNEARHKLTTMKKQFTLQEWMTENRELVIASYNALKEEKFFSGITMKEFGLSVFRAMSNNNPKSANRAATLLPNVMGMVYSNNTSCGVTYSKPYSESNHAKQVSYFGTEKTNQLNAI